MTALSQYYELAIIAFILMGIGFVMWRGGQANPESTGKIGRRLAGLERRVGHVESQIKATATTDDITRLQGQIATLLAAVEGDRKMQQLTYHSVKRMEDHLIENALRDRS